jgi:hypothetical protein
MYYIIFYLSIKLKVLSIARDITQTNFEQMNYHMIGNANLNQIGHKACTLGLIILKIIILKVISKSIISNP